MSRKVLQRTGSTQPALKVNAYDLVPPRQSTEDQGRVCNVPFHAMLNKAPHLLPGSLQRLTERRGDSHRAAGVAEYSFIISFPKDSTCPGTGLLASPHPFLFTLLLMPSLLLCSVSPTPAAPARRMTSPPLAPVPCPSTQIYILYFSTFNIF